MRNKTKNKRNKTKRKNKKVRNKTRGGAGTKHPRNESENNGNKTEEETEEDMHNRLGCSLGFICEYDKITVKKTIEGNTETIQFEHSGENIGYAIVIINPPKFEIFKIEIRDPYKGSGCGKCILKHLLNY